MKDLEFLAEQQRRAIEGIERASADIGHEIERVVDVPGIVRRHPFLSLGTGAVAAFALGRFAPAVSLAPLFAAARGPLRATIQMLIATAIAEKSAEHSI
jgi:hypothetical protein